MVQRITLNVPDIGQVDVFVDYTNTAVVFKHSKNLCTDKEMFRGIIADAIVEHCVSAVASQSGSLKEMRETLWYNCPLFTDPKVLFIDEFMNGKN